MSAETAIRLDRLSKRYEPSAPLVLEEISLDVRAGEFVCLVGASGCGKSTLLSIIAGLEPPTTGTVEVTGERAAMMFQESALLPWLTARRNVEFALELRGVAAAERREQALDLLDLVNLAPAADKRPHQLSGGMRQRVALARALAQDRPVLLMDEPFAAVDAITRDLLHVELERIWLETGRTIVFVTHNVGEAITLGDRIILLGSRPGRIAAEWSIDRAARATMTAADLADLQAEITGRLRQGIRANAA
ncbi:ABC transporter ATP-binding protein [Diaminobutyricibacter tongyongensis]|uniref:ABC transporter ATP-binding protein n=1 Tax=Leifsonia tongyongensis TaxID=1268043 RepID=A0A6L9XTH0_9MICO|nr:ABC transporter ATP-binding protein [Diaminobutyricibacter tongyongensis]